MFKKPRRVADHADTVLAEDLNVFYNNFRSALTVIKEAGLSAPDLEAAVNSMQDLRDGDYLYAEHVNVIVTAFKALAAFLSSLAPDDVDVKSFSDLANAIPELKSGDVLVAAYMNVLADCWDLAERALSKLFLVINAHAEVTLQDAWGVICEIGELNATVTATITDYWDFRAKFTLKASATASVQDALRAGIFYAVEGAESIEASVEASIGGDVPPSLLDVVALSDAVTMYAYGEIDAGATASVEDAWVARYIMLVEALETVEATVSASISVTTKVSLLDAVSIYDAPERVVEVDVPAHVTATLSDAWVTGYIMPVEALETVEAEAETALLGTSELPLVDILSMSDVASTLAKGEVKAQGSTTLSDYWSLAVTIPVEHAEDVQASVLAALYVAQVLALSDAVQLSDTVELTESGTIPATVSASLPDAWAVEVTMPATYAEEVAATASAALEGAVKREVYDYLGASDSIFNKTSGDVPASVTATVSDTWSAVFKPIAVQTEEISASVSTTLNVTIPHSLSDAVPLTDSVSTGVFVHLSATMSTSVSDTWTAKHYRVAKTTETISGTLDVTITVKTE